MANRLKMAVTETIQTLRRRGWSARRIARELGVDRETVARQLRAPPAGSNAAKAPPGSPDIEPGSNTANAPSGSQSAKPSRYRPPPPTRSGT